MNRIMQYAIAGMLLCVSHNGLEARGFGGFRGGGFSAGGFRAGGASYSGARSFESASGFRGGYGASNSFDRSFSDARGGSFNVEGNRGIVGGPFGGFAAGGQRDVTATTAGGRTFSGSRDEGVAAGPFGRTIGGESRAGIATGPGGAFAVNSRSAFAGTRFSTDFGLAHYSSFNAAGVGHSTAYWSRGAVTTRAGFVRTGFGYYNCFHPNWYATHPGCWTAANWAAATAWRAATWSAVNSFCGIPVVPIDYDYGNTVIYQDNSVYVNGTNVASAADYANQATTLADNGQKAAAPPEAEWKALGVFALVQGEEKTSNNLFQLAVNKEGVLRGNYYDGLMDTTSAVFGSVDKKTQRAAWTIGKKNDRVFETGIYNLTKPEASVLVHFGTDRTQQWLLVRMESPNDSK
jgi:hypothetical protein